MIKSIQHFEEISTGVFEKLIGKFMRNPMDIASFTTGIMRKTLSKTAGSPHGGRRRRNVF